MQTSYLLEGKEHVLGHNLHLFMTYFFVSENIRHIGPTEAIIRNFKGGKGIKTN